MPSYDVTNYSISAEEFEQLRRIIYTRFGIHLTEKKRSLVVGRLQKLLRQKGFTTFQSYLDYLEQSGDTGLSDLINLISTNYTYFNREKDHFTFLEESVLPIVSEKLAAQNQRDLRIWCAGCSTGEEAYMLLITMMEYFGSDYKRWDAGILATDISERALRIAKEGVYSAERLESLPEKWRQRYFRKRSDGQFEIIPQVRQEATFRRFNLMNTTFPFKKPFHIIFCRNVMIYFDQQTRHSLVERFCQHNTPGGFLFIGHSETLGRGHPQYEYLHPAVYRKKELSP